MDPKGLIAMHRHTTHQVGNSYGSSRFWLRCGIVLGSLLVLAVAKEVTLERMIHGLDTDGALINDAGRQRMLSQQIMQFGLAAAHEKQADNQAGVEQAMTDLEGALKAFEAGHLAVQQRVLQADCGEWSPGIVKRFREIEPHYVAVIRHANQALIGLESVAPTSWRPDVATYLDAMNSIVDALAVESRQRVLAARRVSRWGLVATFVISALAAFVVLVPSIRKASHDRHAYQEALGQLNMERTAGDVLNDSLRGALALNRAVFSTAADSVIILNREGVIEQANASAAETFDIPEEQLVDSRINDLMSEQDADVHDEYLRHACESTADGVLLRNHSVCGKRSDGSHFPAELSVSKVQVAGRTVFTGILRDISERVQLESSLAQARKMESVGQLASGIAHEINTPMQFIATNISYLSRQLEGWIGFFNGLREIRQSGLPAKELERKQLELIQDAPKEITLADLRGAIDDSLVGVDRVVEIISAMKDFAHPGTESKGLVDINHVLETAAVIARNRTKEVARVTLELDKECKPFPGVVTGLNQTFVNLLVNAADAIEDATTTHGGIGDIRISTQWIEGGVEVLVSDTGCGMSEEVAAHAFDPFYTTKDIGKGSGQGLSIAYNAVVDQHQGKIAIESAPGEGTTFRIFLPINQSSEGEGVEAELLGVLA